MRAFPRRLILLLVLLAGLIAVARWRQPPADDGRGAIPTSEQLRQLAAELTGLEARERQAAETHWAPEMMAERAGAVFERLWDSLNASSDRLGVAVAFAVGEVWLPEFLSPKRLPHGIQMFDPMAPEFPASPASDWRGRLAVLAGEGWEMVQCEFRHNRFEPAAEGRPGRSRFWFSAHFVNERLIQRASLTGDLHVEWSEELDEDGLPRVRRVDARRLQLMTRDGPPAFSRVLYEVVAPPPKSHFIDPLIVHDLDGDGTNEIILASANAVFRWRGGQFVRSRFCADGPGLIFTGAIADFDGDGRDDFLCARFEGLFLFRGDGTGSFSSAPEFVWPAPARLRYGQVITAADVDGDGDLDVWLGQYKNPYDGGQMPTPTMTPTTGIPHTC
ncbi:MAG: VCBS repeat-containing protein [Verrucomicrobia bacterium]|nr:VCBS repeat-containing protein [Verrucomicrobiota bacterium]